MLLLRERTVRPFRSARCAGRRSLLAGARFSWRSPLIMGEEDLMHQTIACGTHSIWHGSYSLSASSTGSAVPSLAETLVDPRSAFRHPAEVVTHPLLSREEKRTILISWIRDEIMLEHVASRVLPELKPASQIDAVIRALQDIDPHAADEYRAAANAVGERSRACGG